MSLQAHKISHLLTTLLSAKKKASLRLSAPALGGLRVFWQLDPTLPNAAELASPAGLLPGLLCGTALAATPADHRRTVVVESWLALVGQLEAVPL